MSVTIALAGNPNCGKTTIFNALTGSEQYVGNWPGVTVEKKEGRLVSDPEITIADLPGIYSLSPYTPEEVVARNYLVSSPPDVILNILDGTNIERNLYLTTQLMELGIPMVVLINMADVLEKRGDVIDLKKFSKALGGCPVFEVSALKGDGLRRAVDAAVALARKPSNTNPIGFSAPVEESVLEIQKIISPACQRREQRRFFAVKVFERDERLSELIGELPERAGIEEIIKKTEKKLEDDSESIITTERYAKITSIIQLHKPRGRRRAFREDRQRAHQPLGSDPDFRGGYVCYVLCIGNVARRDVLGHNRGQYFRRLGNCARCRQSVSDRDRHA